MMKGIKWISESTNIKFIFEGSHDESVEGLVDDIEATRKVICKGVKFINVGKDFTINMDKVKLAVYR